ncbi:hypothetical protein [Nocardia brasiliensis]
MVSPQYPSGYNPYPGYPGVVPAPSGATAITAGVLACVGAVGQLLGGAVNLVFGIIDIGHELGEYDSTGLLGQSWYRTFALTTGVVAMVTAVPLGVGAIGLLRRKQFGRMLVVVGCVAVIVLGIVSFALVQSAGGSWDSSLGVSTGISGLVGLLFPVGTAVLALVPATTRWLAHTPAPPAYPYAPAAPWPQQPFANSAQPQLDWQAPPQAPGVPNGQPAWGVPTPGNQPVPGPHSSWAAPGPTSEAPPAAWGAPGVTAQTPPADPPSVPPQAPWQNPAAPGDQPPAQADDSAWNPPALPGSSNSDETTKHPPPA